MLIKDIKIEDNDEEAQNIVDAILNAAGSFPESESETIFAAILIVASSVAIHAINDQINGDVRIDSSNASLQSLSTAMSVAMATIVPRLTRIKSNQ